MAVFTVSILAAGSSFAFAQGEPFIAGTTPDHRPSGAPHITKFDRSAAWQAEAYAGIAKPLPPLKFLNDQGAWYTPFTHPGMRRPYDIRGLNTRGDAAMPPLAKGSTAKR